MYSFFAPRDCMRASCLLVSWLACTHPRSTSDSVCTYSKLRLILWLISSSSILASQELRLKFDILDHENSTTIIRFIFTSSSKLIYRRNFWPRQPSVRCKEIRSLVVFSKWWPPPRSRPSEWETGQSSRPFHQAPPTACKLSAICQIILTGKCRFNGYSLPQALLQFAAQ